MAKASGFAVLLPKDRITTFLECVAEERAFAEPVADLSLIHILQPSNGFPMVLFAPIHSHNSIIDDLFDVCLLYTSRCV